MGELVVILQESHKISIAVVTVVPHQHHYIGGMQNHADSTYPLPGQTRQHAELSNDELHKRTGKDMKHKLSFRR